VTQDVGPEFKLQYQKKERKKPKHPKTQNKQQQQKNH
jgi:hypothetical protein